MSPETSTRSGATPERTSAWNRLALLRLLLWLDAAVLFVLGTSFVIVPEQVQRAFHFQGLPEGVNYMIGLWGCVLATMGMGYAVAAKNPLRHVVWVQMGIARGALEAVLGLVYLQRGIVTWQQAGMGILVAAFITVAYIVLYPRRTAVIRLTTGAKAAPASAAL